MNLPLQFASPLYLLLLPVLPLLLALYVYALRHKQKALRIFIESALARQLVHGFSRRRQWVKALCVIAAAGLLIVALAQPQWGTRQEDIGRQGRDLYIMLDVSLSMLAEDAPPNRLQRAKAGIRELVEQIRTEGGHRLALIAFAGRANLQCPPTLDYDFFLQRLNEVNSETIPRQGSLIGDALRQTLQGFGTLDPAYSDIILLTDGDDHGSFPLEAAKLVQAQQVSLYIVGVGDAGKGALIPVNNHNGEREYLRYQDFDVRSQMRQSLLLELARITDGIYEPAGTGPIDLKKLYRQHITGKPRRPIDSASGERPVPRFQWFILLALILLTSEMLLRERSKINPMSDPD
jgi:Ca-activated chloride channel family protein